MTGARSLWLLYPAGGFILLADLVFSSPGISQRYGFPVNLYYCSLFLGIFLLHRFIFVNFKQYFVTFLLYGLSINKLLDEFFFDPTKLQLNELLFLIAFLIFGYFRQRLISRSRKVVANGSICDSECNTKNYDNE